MKSLKGHLLVATPELLDPNFFKSVVLIVQHDEEGALGLILNRPTQTSVAEAWEQVSDVPCRLDQVLHLGGPCQGVIMALHTQAAMSQIEVLPNAAPAPAPAPGSGANAPLGNGTLPGAGVHFSAEEDAINWLVQQQHDGPVKLFLGYSGWGAGQLEGEMESGSWTTLPAQYDHVFDDADEQWQRVQRQIALQGLPPQVVPKDPKMN
jgi:putative transcriptional regulator